MLRAKIFVSAVLSPLERSVLGDGDCSLWGKPGFELREAISAFL